MLSKAEFDLRFGTGRNITPPFPVKPHQIYKSSIGAVVLYANSTMGHGGVSVNAQAYDSFVAWSDFPNDKKFIVLKNAVCPEPWTIYLELDGLPDKPLQVKNGSQFRVFDREDFVVPAEFAGTAPAEVTYAGSDIPNEPVNWATVTLQELATAVGRTSIRSMEIEPFLTYCKSEGLKVLINGDGKIMIPRNRIVAPF